MFISRWLMLSSKPAAKCEMTWANKMVESFTQVFRRDVKSREESHALNVIKTRVAKQWVAQNMWGQNQESHKVARKSQKWCIFVRKKHIQVRDVRSQWCVSRLAFCVPWWAPLGRMEQSIHVFSGLSRSHWHSRRVRCAEEEEPERSAGFLSRSGSIFKWFFRYLISITWFETTPFSAPWLLQWELGVALFPENTVGSFYSQIITSEFV